MISDGVWLDMALLRLARQMNLLEKFNVNPNHIRYDLADLIWDVTGKGGHDRERTMFPIPVNCSW